MAVLVVLLGMWVLVASMRAHRAERECDELRAQFLRWWDESVKAEERRTREQHRADAAEARATALRQAMQEGRGALRKLLRHHRDKHHAGTQPYDQEVAMGLWHMEMALADEGLPQQRHSSTRYEPSPPCVCDGCTSEAFRLGAPKSAASHAFLREGRGENVRHDDPSPGVDWSGFYQE